MVEGMWHRVAGRGIQCGRGRASHLRAAPAAGPALCWTRCEERGTGPLATTSLGRDERAQCGAFSGRVAERTPIAARGVRGGPVALGGLAGRGSGAPRVVSCSCGLAVPEGKEAWVESASHIAHVLRRGGHEAFIVGGFVRDCLLGIPPGDVDVATSAQPDQVQALFKHTVEMPKQVSLVIHQGVAVEVTTFRGSDASSAEQDARLRDFTVNSIFYDPETGRVVDFVGGVRDAGRRVLRGNGDPGARMREDPLRILRAARLCASLPGFSLCEQTERAMRQEARLLPSVARERIQAEMRKLAAAGSSAWATGLSTVWQAGAHEHVVPACAREGFEAAVGRARTIADLEQEGWECGCASEDGGELGDHGHLANSDDSLLGARLAAMLPLDAPEADYGDLCSFLKLGRHHCREVEVVRGLRLLESQEQASGSDPDCLDLVELYATKPAPLLRFCLLSHAAALPDGPARATFGAKHARRQGRFSRSIERRKAGQRVVRSATMMREGASEGPGMKVLLDEAERISAERDMHEEAQVLQELMQTSEWARWATKRSA